MKEEIVIDGQICAVIHSAKFDKPGIQFFTPRRARRDQAHTHNCVLRETSYTQEALFIRKGNVRVDFYTQQQECRTSRVLGAADVIVLILGGHGFEVLEDLIMVEVKQGLYVGDADKTGFEVVLPSKLNFE